MLRLPLLFAFLLGPAPAAEAFKPSTSIRIVRGSWEMNGRRTYEGAAAEGLLLNVRMVNAVFEDRNPATRREGFDPEQNTGAFIAKIPDYAEHGVRAFTICLQGGSPGPRYTGALNSAVDPDGSLRPDYLKRVARVIEACDRSGVAVILGCFYQQQDQVLKDEDAVRKAVERTARWVRERGYTNVLLEIANELQHGGFDRSLLKSPGGVAELIELARKAAPGLLVSASGVGDGRVPPEVEAASSFLLLHFNGTPVSEIRERAAAARRAQKAVVCNEDDKKGEEGAAALEAACGAACSWGYMNKEKNQFFPFKFEGAADDPVVYAKLKALAAPR